MLSKHYDGGYLAAMERHKRALRRANGHRSRTWLIAGLVAACVVVGLIIKVTR